VALHLLRQPEEQIRSFADALLAARSQVGQCRRCFHLSADTLCEICLNTERQNGQLCVVADSRDLLALDPAGQYSDRVRLMCDFCRRHPDQDVPDPYYGGPEGFQYVIDLLLDACEGLLDYVLDHPVAPSR